MLSKSMVNKENWPQICGQEQKSGCKRGFFLSNFSAAIVNKQKVEHDGKFFMAGKKSRIFPIVLYL
jgi:hypothetical protein